jgi:uracil-DNA glycosylase family 4
MMEGTGSNGVLILGEAMDSFSLEDGGLPLRPASPGGAILERAINRIGARREQFYIWNAIPTCPPGALKGPWMPAAMAWGRHHLEKVLTLYRPCAILALGNIAAQMATGLAGKDFNIGMIEGYTFPDAFGYKIVVVPTFHPSFLRRGAMHLYGCLLRDLDLAITIVRDRLESKAPPLTMDHYYLYPTSGYLEIWASNFEARVKADAAKALGKSDISPMRISLAYDIETPYSRLETEEEAEDDEDAAEVGDTTTIESIQFSDGPGSGIFMPWREPYIQIAKRLLALDCPKYSWNGWRFDDPRLLANGMAIGGVNYDLMWAWHHLQPDLPRGLQFAAKFMGWPYAWKHLSGSRPEFYGITDCDVLQTIAPPLFNSLKKTGLWSGYTRHILQLEPILQKMSSLGMPVDPKRFEEVRFDLACRADGTLEEIQSLVPMECRPLKIYKKEPKKKDGVMLMGDVWGKFETWKPSNQKLTDYTKFRGYDLPHDFKTKKVSFAQIYMKRLFSKTKDPLFEKVIEYKDVATVLSNHIANWEPDTSGRVHSTFYYIPATGQLSSKRPNIQNAPKHKKEQGDLFRSIIRATEGKVLIEFDYKSFHALTLGFEAGDPDYMRLSRLDIHSYVTAHLLRLPDRDRLLELPDESLGRRLSEIKKAHKAIRDTKAKRTILGYGFGLGYRKLYDMNREDFTNETEAKNLLKLIDSLFPLTKKFRDDVRVRAHEQGYLLSRHGYIRRFWEVMKFVPGSGLVPGGEQSEAAIAFLPANDAFGRIKEAMLSLEYLGFLGRYGFINTIHDSLLFECPESLVEECLANVWPIMEGASGVLGCSIVAPKGLRCEVSASMGKSWEKMEELKRGTPFVC